LREGGNVGGVKSKKLKEGMQRGKRAKKKKWAGGNESSQAGRRGNRLGATLKKKGSHQGGEGTLTGRKGPSGDYFGIAFKKDRWWGQLGEKGVKN